MMPTDRTPMVLLPYQQRWIADTNPVKVCELSLIHISEPTRPY